MRNYIIIGMPGSGKTTLSKEAASLAGLAFVDIDDEITAKHGGITGIFDNEGEAAFRKYETEELYNAVSGNVTVISTGGGIIEKEENRELMKDCTVIFIDRSIENIMSTLDSHSRPLLKDKENAIRDLWKRRYPIYLEVADFQIKNDGTFDECVDKIVRIIKND